MQVSIDYSSRTPVINNKIVRSSSFHIFCWSFCPSARPTIYVQQSSSVTKRWLIQNDHTTYWSHSERWNPYLNRLRNLLNKCTALSGDSLDIQVKLFMRRQFCIYFTKGKMFPTANFFYLFLFSTLLSWGLLSVESRKLMTLFDRRRTQCVDLGEQTHRNPPMNSCLITND